MYNKNKFLTNLLLMNKNIIRLKKILKNKYFTGKIICSLALKNLEK